MAKTINGAIFEVNNRNKKQLKKITVIGGANVYVAA